MGKEEREEVKGPPEGVRISGIHLRPLFFFFANPSSLYPLSTWSACTRSAHTKELYYLRTWVEYKRSTRRFFLSFCFNPSTPFLSSIALYTHSNGRQHPPGVPGKHQNQNNQTATWKTRREPSRKLISTTDKGFLRYFIVPLLFNPYPASISLFLSAHCCNHHTLIT